MNNAGVQFLARQSTWILANFNRSTRCYGVNTGSLAGLQALLPCLWSLFLMVWSLLWTPVARWKSCVSTCSGGALAISNCQYSRISVMPSGWTAKSALYWMSSSPVFRLEPSLQSWNYETTHPNLLATILCVWPSSSCLTALFLPCVI